MSRRKKSRRKHGLTRPAPESRGRTIGGAPSHDYSTVSSLPNSWLVGGGAVLLLAILWAYWPTLLNTVQQWIKQPDYSHGFLVLPIALFFLWSRKQALPLDQASPSYLGAGLLIVAGAVRALAGLYFMVPLDGWTLPITVAGCVLLLFGRHVLLWSLPSILFLWFAFPIPYSFERSLSLPLQRIATKLSTISLQMLGQPAISEGNTILLGENHLFVEEACSGMRIFVGIVALAFAYVLFTSWNWWQKALVLCASAPVAIIANVSRIVVTALLYEFVSGDVAHKFSHDIAGLLMIPLAALLFWLFLIYLERLFPEVEEVAPVRLGTT